MAAEAFSVPLPLSVVVPAAADADAAKLQREIGHYTVDVYYDPNATLRKTFRPVGVEAVLVSGNGKVLDLRPVTVQNVANLDAPLQNLLLTPQASE
jgi:hypothetical protein